MPLSPADLPTADADLDEIARFAHTFDGYEIAGSLGAVLSPAP